MPRKKLGFERLEDRRLLATGLISLNRPENDSGNDDSFQDRAFPYPVRGARLSADGRYAVFLSYATNLVSTPKGNEGADVYVRDRQTGVTELVSVNRVGNASGNWDSIDCAISANGRYVVFESAASNLVPGGTTYITSNIFVRDIIANTTELVSVDRDGQRSLGGNTISTINLSPNLHPPSGRYISDNGRYVVFTSTDSNIVSNDYNGNVDVFVRDLIANQTTLVSRNRDANDPDIVSVTGNGDSFESVISADGRYVAFRSYASNLVAGVNDGHGLPDVFRYDLTTEVMKYVSVTPSGGVPVDGSYEPQISADGQVIAFRSFADLEAADDNIEVDAYVRDMRQPRGELVSKAFNGQAANESSYHVVISDDGRFVAFSSDADNLTANDGDGTDGSLETRDRDIFVRNLATNVTTLVSVNSTGAGSGNLKSDWPTISGNGRYVAYESAALNLITNFDHFNGPDDADVFLRDLGARTTKLLSATRGSTVRTGRGHSVDAQISRDGRYVAFASSSYDLVARDTNGTGVPAQGTLFDVFVSPDPYTVPVPGVLIAQSGGSTQVVEGGATDTYTLVLRSAPTANVTIHLLPNVEVTTSRATITFTPLNWYVSQSVLVRAVNDAQVEGIHNGLIRHTSSSSDAKYQGLTIANVVPRITDNDGGLQASDELAADEALAWWEEETAAKSRRNAAR